MKDLHASLLLALLTLSSSATGQDISTALSLLPMCAVGVPPYNKFVWNIQHGSNTPTV
jgi:hypothetical protein